MTEALGDNAARAFRDLVEDIEALEEEKAGVATAISAKKKAIKAELGIDPPLVNKLLKIRKMDPERRSYEEEQIALMLGALGESE